MHPSAAGVNVLVEVPDEEPDEELAARAAGDFDAFAELYRRYLMSVYRLVRAQTPDDATAEDLTAHIFFKALSSAGTFRNDGSYRSWLFRIAHNVVTSWHSRRGRSLTVEEVPEKADPTPSPASLAIASEQRDVVWSHVAELPPAQREVVTLKYAEGLANDEIARATRRSRGAVRILLHRARHKLRGALEGKDLM